MGNLNALERKLHPYQMKGVAPFLATGRVQRGLVIVPASLKEQWQRE